MRGEGKVTQPAVVCVYVHARSARGGAQTLLLPLLEQTLTHNHTNQTRTRRRGVPVAGARRARTLAELGRLRLLLNEGFVLAGVLLFVCCVVSFALRSSERQRAPPSHSTRRARAHTHTINTRPAHTHTPPPPRINRSAPTPSLTPSCACCAPTRVATAGWCGGGKDLYPKTACPTPRTMPTKHTHTKTTPPKNTTTQHWGKAGWPTHARCFDGAAEYGTAWCR